MTQHLKESVHEVSPFQAQFLGKMKESTCSLSKEKISVYQVMTRWFFPPSQSSQIVGTVGVSSTLQLDQSHSRTPTSVILWALRSLSLTSTTICGQSRHSVFHTTLLSIPGHVQSTWSTYWRTSQALLYLRTYRKSIKQLILIWYLLDLRMRSGHWPSRRGHSGWLGGYRPNPISIPKTSCSKYTPSEIAISTTSTVILS